MENQPREWYPGDVLHADLLAVFASHAYRAVVASRKSNLYVFERDHVRVCVAFFASFLEELRMVAVVGERELDPLERRFRRTDTKGTVNAVDAYLRQISVDEFTATHETIDVQFRRIE